MKNIDRNREKETIIRGADMVEQLISRTDVKHIRRRVCGKMNHFENMCRSSGKKQATRQGTQWEQYNAKKRVSAQDVTRYTWRR